MVQLRGMTWNHPRGYSPLRALSERFKTLHPDVEIAWDCRSLKDFGDYPVDRLAQTYDLIMIDHPHVGICSAQGVLVPFDEWAGEDYLREQAEHSVGRSHLSYQWEGRQMALAADAAAQVAAYRPDLLNGVGLPRTWEEVRALAAALPAGSRVGWPLCPTDAMCSFLSLCADSGGAGFFDEECGVPQSIGEQALERMLELLPLLHPQSLAMNPIQMYDLMAGSGEIAYVPLAFGYSNYARTSHSRHLLKFGNIPSHTGVPQGSLLGGVGIAVSAFSAHIPLAVQYAMFTASRDVQRGEYFGAGGQPGHAAAWRDPEVNRLSHNFFADTLATLEKSYMRPRNRAFPAFQEQAGVLLHEALQQAAAGERVHVQALLRQMNLLYGKALQECGR